MMGFFLEFLIKGITRFLPCPLSLEYIPLFESVLFVPQKVS